MNYLLCRICKGAATIFAGMLFISGSIVFAAGGRPATDPGGGIGGTGITGFGVVQQFGSIFVNGREYALNRDTRVTRDGQSSNLQALRLGQVVEVHGSIDHRSGRSTADSVEIHASLQGRVDAIDPTTASFSLLGQTVRLTGSTFGGGPSEDRMKLSQLHIGEEVNVSGLRDADGTWIATRVTMASDTNPENFQVRGAIMVVNRAKGKLRVGENIFRVNPGLLAGFAPGDRVVVTGRYSGSLPVVASLYHDVPSLGRVGELVEMSGYVQRQPAPRQMVSNDVTLHYSGDVTVIGGSVADIKPGVPIGVAGQVQSDGSIAVREIMVNIDPLNVAISRLSLLPPRNAKSDGRSGGNGKPQGERPVDKSSEGIERPEIERPEIERPDISVPEMDN